MQWDKVEKQGRYGLCAIYATSLCIVMWLQHNYEPKVYASQRTVVEKFINYFFNCYSGVYALKPLLDAFNALEWRKRLIRVQIGRRDPVSRRVIRDEGWLALVKLEVIALLTFEELWSYVHTFQHLGLCVLATGPKGSTDHYVVPVQAVVYEGVKTVFCMNSQEPHSTRTIEEANLVRVTESSFTSGECYIVKAIICGIYCDECIGLHLDDGRPSQRSEHEKWPSHAIPMSPSPQFEFLERMGKLLRAPVEAALKKIREERAEMPARIPNAKALPAPASKTKKKDSGYGGDGGNSVLLVVCEHSFAPTDLFGNTLACKAGDKVLIIEEKGSWLYGFKNCPLFGTVEGWIPHWIGTPVVLEVQKPMPRTAPPPFPPADTVIEDGAARYSPDSDEANEPTEFAPRPAVSRSRSRDGSPFRGSVASNPRSISWEPPSPIREKHERGSDAYKQQQRESKRLQNAEKHVLKVCTFTKNCTGVLVAYVNKDSVSKDRNPKAMFHCQKCLKSGRKRVLRGQ